MTTLKGLFDEVKTKEQELLQAKNNLNLAQYNVAKAACPFKEGDIVIGWRDCIAQVSEIYFTGYRPYYGIKVNPITKSGKFSKRSQNVYFGLENIKIYEVKE